MSFLIAQILGLLALAAVFGGLLGYWLARRNFIDVSAELERYEHSVRELVTLREEHADALARVAALEAEGAQLSKRLSDEIEWRAAIQPRLDAIKPLSLDPVASRLDSLTDTVAGIRPTDTSGLERKIDAVDAAVSKLRPVDVAPLEARIKEVQTAVGKLENADVTGIESGVAATAAALEAMTPPNLDPVTAKLNALDTRIASLRNTDLNPIDTRLRNLAESIRALESKIKPQPAIDLTDIRARLDSIEKALAKAPAVASRPRAPKATGTPTRKPRRRSAGALLEAASYGKPDDLKRIRGIGPKLEKMLNDLGVYYYFQVDAWSDTDVKRVDDLLPAFKGRIERDEWVRQASTLAKQPTAARMT